MPILLKLRKADNGFNAYRPTTGERGFIASQHIPKRIRREVDEKGAAWAVADKKNMLVEGENADSR